MFKILYRTVLPLFFLSACVSVVDETIPLSNDFKENSNLIRFEEPVLGIFDSAYNQALGEYDVVNSNVSWQSKDENLVSKRRESNFINYLLFDDNLSFIVEEFEVDSSQRLSFELQENGQLVSKSKCEIFSQSIGEQTTSSTDGESSTSSRIDNRLQTYLFCVIEHNNDLWELTLYSNDEEPTEVELKTENRFYRVHRIPDQIDLVKSEGRIEKVTLPSWASFDKGLEFLNDNGKVSALSFVGKPKVWLKNDLDKDAKEVLLTASYSLSLFNWLDDEWR